MQALLANFNHVSLISLSAEYTMIHATIAVAVVIAIIIATSMTIEMAMIGGVWR